MTWHEDAPAKGCGRLDIHEPHTWTTHEAEVWRRREIPCPGHITTEGGHPCVTCQRPRAACYCATERAAAEHEEWYAE